MAITSSSHAEGRQFDHGAITKIVALPTGTQCENVTVGVEVRRVGLNGIKSKKQHRYKEKVNKGTGE